MPKRKLVQMRNQVGRYPSKFHLERFNNDRVAFWLNLGLLAQFWNYFHYSLSIAIIILQRHLGFFLSLMVSSVVAWSSFSYSWEGGWTHYWCRGRCRLQKWVNVYSSLQITIFPRSFALDMRLWKWCTSLWLLTYISESLYVLVFIFLAYGAKIDVMSHWLSFECQYMSFKEEWPHKGGMLSCEPWHLKIEEKYVNDNTCTIILYMWIFCNEKKKHVQLWVI